MTATVEVCDYKAGIPALAIELLGRPLYWLWESDGVPAHIGGGNRGLAGRTLDVLAREWLSQRGEWTGRRAAVYVADQAISAGLVSVGWDEPAELAHALAEHVLGMALHEMSHVLEVGEDLSEPTPHVEQIAEAVRAISFARLTDTRVPLWDGHTLPFIRTAVHLNYRSRWRGYACDFGQVFDAGAYGLSPARQYYQAILPEAKRLEDVPLAELSNYAPPAEAVRLWRADVRRWRDSQSSLSPTAARLCAAALNP